MTKALSRHLSFPTVSSCISGLAGATDGDTRSPIHGLPPAAGLHQETGGEGSGCSSILFFFSFLFAMMKVGVKVSGGRRRRSPAACEVISWCEGSPGTWRSGSGGGSPFC